MSANGGLLTLMSLTTERQLPDRANRTSDPSQTFGMAAQNVCSSADPISQPASSVRLVSVGERPLTTVRVPMSAFPSCHRQLATRWRRSRFYIAVLRADHSISLSALIRIVCGISIPSALAVFMLITSSNLVGCSTGISAGFFPLKIIATCSAARRK